MKISNRPINEEQYDATTQLQQYHTPDIAKADHRNYHFTVNDGEYECDCVNFTQVFPDMKSQCSPKAIFLNYPETPHQHDDPTKIDREAEINEECYKKFNTKQTTKF